MKKYLIFYIIVMLFVLYRSMFGQEKLIYTDIIELGIRTDKSNYALFNSPIFTYHGNIYVCFVQPDELSSGKYKTVIGKYSGGEWQYCDVEPNTSYDPWHTEPSLALDTLGYIHVTYNMHSSPWQYCKSILPENISSWEFLEQKLEGPHDKKESSYISGNGTANIPGNRITYQYMTIDREGTIYISYRECKYCSQGTDYYGMQWSLGISKYDVLSKTWQRLGPEGGVRPFATEPVRRAQVGRIFFDLNNRMHITWNWYHEYERDGFWS